MLKNHLFLRQRLQPIEIYQILTLLAFPHKAGLKRDFP